jgi:hypothetical protein
MKSDFLSPTLGNACRFISILIILSAASLYSQIPRTISYQGVLTDSSGNSKPDGSYSFTFSLYETASGGSPVWSEIKTLIVKNGLFSTYLGDQTIFPDSLKFDKPYWLGIKVANESELTPRIVLNSTPYSFASDIALNVADGKVVKSLNNLKDNVTIEGSGGTAVNTSGDKITISSNAPEIYTMDISGMTWTQVGSNSSGYLSLTVNAPNVLTSDVVNNWVILVYVHSTDFNNWALVPYYTERNIRVTAELNTGSITLKRDQDGAPYTQSNFSTLRLVLMKPGSTGTLN